MGLKTIGILSLQGDFSKHKAQVESLRCATRPVRYPEDLQGLDGLIFPGGESTTIGKLMERHGLLSALSQEIADGFPVFATCAGTILLAREIQGYRQPHIGAMDIVVSRNAYGRQVESFEADILFQRFGPPPIRSVFIRAPIILECGDQVEVVGRFEDRPVLVREKQLLAATFHPELTEDLRIHRFFLEELA